MSTVHQTPALHEVLSAQLAELLREWGAGDLAPLQARLKTALARATPDELARLAERVETTGADWGYHPPDPLARAISRWVHAEVLLEGSSVENAQALEVARSSPVLLAANHLSFVDLNVFDYLLSETPYRDIADRLAVIVGPKVYARPIRRLASLCFGTLKTAQSVSRASGEAVMSSREVSRISRQTFETAAELLRNGSALAVFVEGSRSRTGAMERALAAVSRYLEAPENLQVLPCAIWGSERLVPLDEDHAHPSRVRLKLGRPVAARALLERCAGRRPLVMDVIGFLIADLLPAQYRGVYGDAESTELAEAHALASELLSAPS